MQVGIKGEKKFVVTKDQLACNVGSGLVSVFATPMMIAAIENTAAASVAGELEEGKTTVGTLVSVSHVAATPEGMEVRIETELTEIAPNGKILTFKVAAYDEADSYLDPIDGIHPREIQPHALLPKSLHSIMLRAAPIISVVFAKECPQTILDLVILCRRQRHADRIGMYSRILLRFAHCFPLLFFWQTVQCLQLFFIF